MFRRVDRNKPAIGDDCTFGHGGRCGAIEDMSRTMSEATPGRSDSDQTATIIDPSLVSAAPNAFPSGLG
jgi:hypothetical protein